MGGHSNYQPKSAAEKWLHERLPIVELVKAQVFDFPTPKNLNYWWTFGGILSLMLVVQIVTGIVLAMHYTPHADLAFDSVEHIMRDVNYGWLLRYMHANGASMFFIAVYIHIFRGMYYGSYKAPREVLWIIGVLIYLVMMATAFMGYVLPWGQMSFWGAKVITNLFSAIPFVGEIDHHLAVGRLCGRKPDAQPLLLAALPVAVRARRPCRPAHLGAACAGQQQPDRRQREIGPGHGAVPSVLHDEGQLRDRCVPHRLRAVPVLRAQLSRPCRSTTRWPTRSRRRPISCRNGTILPFYAILRAIPNKLGGVIAMFGSILILFVLPWLDTSKVRSGTYRPLFKVVLLDLRAWSASALGYLGSKPPEGAYVVLVACLHFLLLLPFPGDHAAARLARDAKAAAVVDLG